MALLLVLLIAAVGARSAALRAPAAAAPTPAPPTTASLLLLHPLLLTRLHLHALPAARLLRVLAVITSTLLHADTDRNAHRRRMARSRMLRIIRRRPLRRRRRLHVCLLLRRDSRIPLAIRPIVAMRPLHRLLRHHRLRLLARLIITPVTAVCRVLTASCMVTLLTGPPTRA